MHQEEQAQRTTSEPPDAAREAPATSRTRHEEEAQRTTSEPPEEEAQRTTSEPLKWIDSHCHVYDERIPDGPDAAVAAAQAAGVTAMITVGCDRATSSAAIDLAARHDGVFATVGLHPHEASNGVETIVDLLDTEGIVAVGEAGLDYFYDHSPREVQRRVFAEQIRLAHERELPLVIHTRDAWDDTFAILDREGTPPRTVFHCFTGGLDEGDECVARGAFLSFSGIVTFASAADVQDAATSCPLDRLLVETDSPYLAPSPHRGKKNRPAWVPHVGEFLAALRGVDVGLISAATVANTERAFPGICQIPT